MQTIHDARIVHGDLKPANFVFVEGVLKLIDFGIAKAINNDTTNIVRDAQIGTLNYMSPEAILDVSGGSIPATGKTPLLKLGRASDVWSLGCILYQMVWGRTPFADLSLMQKLHAIVSNTSPVVIPPACDSDLVDVVSSCLQRDPTSRPSIGGDDGLLAHPFLRPRRAVKAAIDTATRAAATSSAGLEALMRHLPIEAGTFAQVSAAVQSGAAAVDALFTTTKHHAATSDRRTANPDAFRAAAAALRPVQSSHSATAKATLPSLESALRQGLSRVHVAIPSPSLDTTDDAMNTSWSTR